MSNYSGEAAGIYPRLQAGSRHMPCGSITYSASARVAQCVVRNFFESVFVSPSSGALFAALPLSASCEPLLGSASRLIPGDAGNIPSGDL
jgi:hypothetical protein